MIARMMNDLPPLMELQSHMNQLFENIFEDTPALRGYNSGYPAMNLWEENDAAYLEAENPGLSMNDLELLVTGSEFTINGERKIAEQPEAAYHRRERATGRFSRTIRLPWDINADKVEARLRDGVLSVKLPKSEASKPKKVQRLPE
jgi:HSP20 family protein